MICISRTVRLRRKPTLFSCSAGRIPSGSGLKIEKSAVHFRKKSLIMVHDSMLKPSISNVVIKLCGIRNDDRTSSNVFLDQFSHIFLHPSILRRYLQQTRHRILFSRLWTRLNNIIFVYKKLYLCKALTLLRVWPTLSIVPLLV